jgi:DNA primase
MNPENLVSRLDSVRPSGKDRFLAKCPAHKDGSPSLSIRVADDRILLHCFAGCAAADVLAAVGLSLRDLYPERVTHDGAPIRPNHYHARDAALRGLREEITLVAIAAANLRNGVPFDDEDWHRLEQAEIKCRTILELIR